MRTSKEIIKDYQKAVKKVEAIISDLQDIVELDMDNAREEGLYYEDFDGREFVAAMEVLAQELDKAIGESANAKF